MRHSGALAFTERKAPYHRSLCQGGREEVQAADKVVAAGEFGEGLPGLWGIAVNSHLVKASGTGYGSGGLQLAGGGGQLKKVSK